MSYTYTHEKESSSHITPLISVIMRTQNKNTSYLQEAIHSVAQQTYINIELVLVNDGGTNCSELVKQEAIGSIQSIIYRQLETQSGRSHAANVGLDICNGEFIVFLDDEFIFYWII